MIMSAIFSSSLTLIAIVTDSSQWVGITDCSAVFFIIKQIQAIIIIVASAVKRMAISTYVHIPLCGSMYIYAYSHIVCMCVFLVKVTCCCICHALSHLSRQSGVSQFITWFHLVPTYDSDTLCNCDCMIRPIALHYICMYIVYVHI